MPGESITRAGVILYGLASAACGIMDFIWHDFDASHQPIQAFGNHIPGVTMLAYIDRRMDDGRRLRDPVAPQCSRRRSCAGDHLTGICFVLAGLAILSGIQDVLATRLLALMFLAFNVLALPPFIFADTRDHAARGGNAFNLALVGATWIFADAIATRQSVQNQQSAKPSPA
jgi:uncharacterized membrane protein YphA (DoxX/SURF4 family)